MAPNVDDVQRGRECVLIKTSIRPVANTDEIIAMVMRKPRSIDARTHEADISCSAEGGDEATPRLARLHVGIPKPVR